MANAPNHHIVHLENGQSLLLSINGVPCRVIRRDAGPTQRIEFQVCVRGYAAGSRGSDVAELSFCPENRTEPMWEIV
jgi:hypothetical protein